MKTALIACKTLEKEIEKVLSEENPSIDYIFYVASGLHNATPRLQEAIRNEMAKLEGLQVERLLLCFGLCGNVVEGLATGDYETVMPKTDDCITMLLGSAERRAALDETRRGYFLTEGWLQGEANLHREYEKTVKTYGREMADEIYRQIFDGYDYLSLIDTGRQDFSSFYKEGEKIAEDFKLQPFALRGTLGWLRDYLLQRLDVLKDQDKIVIYPPHSSMSWKDFVRE
ncbi:MAG: DUF1638 domain-containing protein [Eubacteriales bacterium]|nr:DUF1638 domain-containing protein [Eubacteriales bacterium]